MVYGRAKPRAPNSDLPQPPGESGTATALGLRVSGQGHDERPRAPIVASCASPESCMFNPETGKSQRGFHTREKALTELGPEQNRNLWGEEGRECGRGDRPSAVPEVCPTVAFLKPSSAHGLKSWPASGSGGGPCCFQQSRPPPGPAGDSSGCRGALRTRQPLMPTLLFLPLQFQIFFVLQVSVFLQLFVLFGILFGFQLPFLVTGEKRKQKNHE